MSERRDLWVPAVLALAGMGLLAWHILHAHGNVVMGAAALVLGLGCAIACLPLRIRRGQVRVVQFGIGAALCLLTLLPGNPWTVPQILALLLAACAFLVPIKAAPFRTRVAMLVIACVLALLSMVAMVGILPKALVWLFVAGAFFLSLQVYYSRVRPEKPPPPGARVCVFGGSFDPFHRGHRALCEAALRVNDRLLVVVAGSAPHKFLGEDGTVDRTPFHHRVAMTRLGVEGLPRTEVLELEGKRAGPSYTVDTLSVLISSYPAGTRWRLLMGADMFQDFSTWREWESILERVTLLVARRPGHELNSPEALEPHSDQILGLEAPELEVSSSAVRDRVGGGGEAGDSVAPPIRAYIRDHGLYREGLAGSR